MHRFNSGNKVPLYLQNSNSNGYLSKKVSIKYTFCNKNHLSPIKLLNEMKRVLNGGVEKNFTLRVRK